MGVIAHDEIAVVLNGGAAPRWIVVSTGLLALTAVLGNPVWVLSRRLTTAVHEGGHALAAYLVGRYGVEVRIPWRGNGVTSHVGRSRGAGLAAAAAAGYTSPPLVGLASAGLLRAGKVTAVLILSVLALAFLLLVVRNGFGELFVASAGASLVVAGRFSPAWVQVGYAHFLTWFLLFSGPKTVLILHRARRQGAKGSDADVLADLTHVPGLVWVLGFGAVSLWCALKGAVILLR
jgi:hypothetical protein